MVSIYEAAKILGMTPNGVRYAVQRGLIPAHAIAVSRLRLLRKDVEAYQPNQRRQKAARASVVERREAGYIG